MLIGERIKEIMIARGHNVCWLAEQIPCERSNVYHIFKRNDIGIELLANISRILEHNFFADLAEDFGKGGE